MPNNRPIKKLGDVTDIFDNQRRPVSSQEREKRNQGKSKNQLYPYYGATRQNGWIDDYIFDEELVLLGEDGADFFDPQKEKAYMINGKSWVNNHAHVLKGKKGMLDNKFLCSYLNSIDYHGYVSGATRLKLNQGSMKDISLPLPPIDIQQLIVAKLDEAFASLDESITLTQANIDKIEEMNKSVLDKVFEEGEREKVKMGDKKILEIIDGDRGSNYPKKDEFFDDGYCLFLNTGNVRQGFFDLEDKQFITKEKDKLLRKGKLKLDDVILTTRGTIGNSAHYDKTIPYQNIRINSGMVLLRTNKELLLPEYLLKFITTPLFHKQRLVMASGSAQPQLPIGILNNIEIPLPPLAKQQEIVKYLDEVFSHSKEIKSEYEAKLEELKELKASILQGAFEGKLI